MKRVTVTLKVESLLSDDEVVDSNMIDGIVRDQVHVLNFEVIKKEYDYNIK